MEFSENLDINDLCNLRKNDFVEGDFFLWRVEFFKIGKRDFTFIREMRVTA